MNVATGKVSETSGELAVRLQDPYLWDQAQSHIDGLRYLDPEALSFVL